MSRIRDNYNFKDVSVNYRYGAESSYPISGFSKPVNQKQINFTLVGKSDRASSVTADKFVATPIFEEFDEIELLDEQVENYGLLSTEKNRVVKKTKVLRLIDLNIINNGSNYTAQNPLTLTFSNLGNAQVEGGLAKIYNQPAVTFPPADLSRSFTITDGGRFEGSHEIEVYTGEQIYFTRKGTGFFGDELNVPIGGWVYTSGVYTGTGMLIYDEFENGRYLGIRTAIGDFSGNVFEAGADDVFAGTFTSPIGSTEVILDVDDDDEFYLDASGEFFQTGSLFLQTGQSQPQYIIRSSRPGGLENADDIRDGVNYSNWNKFTEDPVDRQTYTHVITNQNVDSASPIFDIKRLGDTLHQAEHEYNVTDKPNWLGQGDLKVDVKFRIGNPLDSFVTLRYEWGFLNTDQFQARQVTYNGQTVGGYLVKGPSVTFDSWKSLQQSNVKYNDLTIAQLKSSFPKYIRISKDMFEANSSLVERSVMLDSINEEFNEQYSYPSSAIVATKINSTFFDQIPDRTYDVKMKKVWVPETYNLEHLIEDKRFRKNDINFGQVGNLPFEPKKFFNKLETTMYGSSIAQMNGSLFVSDRDFGTQGQIFVYRDNAGEDFDPTVNTTTRTTRYGSFEVSTVGRYEKSFQMIRDGVGLGEFHRYGNNGTNTIGVKHNLKILSQGVVGSAYDKQPVFDTFSAYSAYSGGETINENRPERWFFDVIIAILMYINIKTVYTGYPCSATHSQLLRVSPKKTALLKCSVSCQSTDNNDDFRHLVNKAAGVVIGTVSNPNQTTPDRILKVVRAVKDQYSARLPRDAQNINNLYTLGPSDTYVTNDSKTDYIWVKFFSAQVKGIAMNRVITPYGIIEGIYITGDISPRYDFNSLHPGSIEITDVTLEDLSMRDYTFDRFDKILASQNGLMLHGAKKFVGFAPETGISLERIKRKNSVLIFKLDANGFYYLFQDLRGPLVRDWNSFSRIYRNFEGIDSQNPAKVSSASFFPDQNRFVALFNKIPLDMCIYRANEVTGLFELEDTIPLFFGVFGDFEIIFSDRNDISLLEQNNPNISPVSAAYSKAPGEVKVLDNNTIIVTFNNNIVIKKIRNHGGNTDERISPSKAFVYRRTIRSGWALDEIVGLPRDDEVISSMDVDVAGVWMTMSGKVDQDFNNWDIAQNASTGIIGLFRYNGKKYEFIREFKSDMLNLTPEELAAINPRYFGAGTRFTYPAGAYAGADLSTEFASMVKIELNDNNEPVIIAGSRDEPTTNSNVNGYVYIFTRDPHTDEWITQKYNPIYSNYELTGNLRARGFSGYVAEIDGSYQIAFDGENVAITTTNIDADNLNGVGSGGEPIVQTFSIKGISKSTRIIENQNWFGMMKKAWSDNPVWIIYDLLTNPVYGAGSVLDDFKDINVFNFFEIAKYFDSVDAKGFYLPIYDEQGRTEPRLSCNFLLENDFNAFDVISSICDMFFGGLYIKEGKYNIWADMPKASSWYFNNHNVLDGNFNYSDANKSSRTTLIRVPYLDKYENFKEKIEFIEDENLMRENGKNEAKLDFTTFTTRSQARRFGKHYLYNKSYETEKIKFITDTKALFLNPGDIIGVEDKLKSFKNQKIFYEVSDINHIEKIYSIQGSTRDLDDMSRFSDTRDNSFQFAEMTFKDANTENFESKTLSGTFGRHNQIDFVDLALDNNGVPYFTLSDEDNHQIYKKNGDDFDMTLFRNIPNFPAAGGGGDFIISGPANSVGNSKNNLAFDIYNTPYFPKTVTTTEDAERQGVTSQYFAPSNPLLTFIKLTGSDFNDNNHWHLTELGHLGNLDSRPHSENIIRIDSNNDKYILTYASTPTGITPLDDNDPQNSFARSRDKESFNGSGEYLLFHCSGDLDDTNPNHWNKYSVGKIDFNAEYPAFDMQLVRGKPAFIYVTHAEVVQYHDPRYSTSSFVKRQIKYKEFTGTNLGLESDWGEVFVKGIEENGGDVQKNATLTFDKSNVPHVCIIDNTQNANFLVYPTNYTDRFSYKNWNEGTVFLKDKGGYPARASSLEFLQNGNALVFEAGTDVIDYLKAYYTSPGIATIESLQFYESSPDRKDWYKPYSWRRQSVFINESGNGGYPVDPLIPAEGEPDDEFYSPGFHDGSSKDSLMADFSPDVPKTAHDLLVNTITLKNDNAFIYDNVFDIDTSIENNLEITNLFAGDITGLYKETQFENFSTKIREENKTESKYLTVTGFETSGSYINLFLKNNEQNSRSIQNLFVNNPMVRPVISEETTYKEYRVLNILEKEPNLYEIEAKEYFSGKFDIIDTFASFVEPEEPEFNIGLPDNEVVRPPAPSGIQFVTGLDDAGSPFLTGMITGEPNGSETEYRLSLLYPNGRVIEKEIEKDTNNLSSLNEPLTDFSFYNLAIVGNYELNAKSLRNPESSDFINEEFTISEIKDKVSTYPFIKSVDLLVNEDLLKIKIRTRNVYGDNLNLFDSNCRINLIIEGKTYVENSKITNFEISFQQIKDLTNSLLREKQIKAQLTYNGTVISEESKILEDEAPKIKNVNFISDGITAGIVAEVEESEKLISIDMKTGENTIKTFAIENQNKLQIFKLEDFEVSKLPKKQKINFNFVPKDFYGTGQSLNCEGFIPEKESLLEKYNNSIIGIYSIYSEDVISTGFSDYESSNNQSGFYGNGQDCLVEFSSSLLSGQSASLNLELVSDTESKPVSIKFQDQGFLSSKKVINLSQKYYNVAVSGESGLFGGFDLKIKKLV